MLCGNRQFQGYNESSLRRTNRENSNLSTFQINEVSLMPKLRCNSTLNCYWLLACVEN